MLLPLTVMPTFFGALGIVLRRGGGAARRAAALVLHPAAAGAPVTPVAWQMYRYSLLYLALLFVAMGVDRALPFGRRRRGSSSSAARRERSCRPRRTSACDAQRGSGARPSDGRRGRPTSMTFGSFRLPSAPPASPISAASAASRPRSGRRVACPTGGELLLAATVALILSGSRASRFRWWCGTCSTRRSCDRDRAMLDRIAARRWSCSSACRRCSTTSRRTC